MLTPEVLAHATDAERQALEDSLLRELALISPLSYAEIVSPWVQRYRHVELLDRLLLDLIEGRLINPLTQKPYRKMAVSMPPQHGKSTIISEHCPAWYLTKYPDRRVILTSYEADFARSWGRKARNHIKEHPEYGIEVDNEAQSADNWEIKGHQGGMSTAGVGGAITGKGAHLLIVDDPVKNAEEAASETMREKAWDWARSTAFSRLRRGGVMVILQTRWHEDDLTGRFLSNERDDWFYVNLPAIAGEDDVLDRPVGAALCPELYNEEELAVIRRTQGPYWWGALYQGTPYAMGSGIFQHPFRYWSYQPSLTGGAPTHVVMHASSEGGNPDEYRERRAMTRFQTIDLAASLKDSADYSVICTWDVTRSRELVLVDRVRVRMEGPDHRDVVIKAFRTWRPKWVAVESATYGLSLIQELIRLGIPIRKLEAKGDKVGRAIPAGSYCLQGKVFFPRDAPWLSEWEHELLAFPKGTHDDQVDNLAYAVQTVVTGVLAFLPKDPEREPTTIEERVRTNVDRTWKRKRRERRSGAQAHPLGRHW
ncbi:MAG: phage terminase large subunit [Candidatus Dormibacteria bacterium]